MTLSLSRMLSAENSAKLSAQSPACRRKPSPRETSASAALSERASPAKTNGGIRRSCSSASASASASGQSGCCAAEKRCHDDGSHFGFGDGSAVIAPDSEVRAGRLTRIAAARSTTELERAAAAAHLLELLLRLHLL